MKISILREKRIQKTVANIFKATTKLKTIWKQPLKKNIGINQFKN
jgi:hypothetical protein